jgi:chromosome segregation ATPase
LNRVLVELASSLSKSNAVKSQLNDSLERLRSVTAEKSTVTLESDELTARYRELEARSSKAIEEATLRTDQASSNQKNLANLTAVQDSLRQALNKNRTINEMHDP